jgi:hypothetical protein
MQLTPYLQLNNERRSHFAKRAQIAPSTITRLERDNWASRATWIRIVLATGWQVTPNDYLPTATEIVNG